MTKNILTLVCVSALALFPGCKGEDPAPTITPPKFEPINFGSATFGSVNDIDGNSYKTVAIGAATWMAENLKATKFNNGDAISEGFDGTAWTATTTPAYYDYGTNQDVISLFGYLYNSYVKDDDRNVCPSGWHVPTPQDWSAVGTALGGASAAGGKMKEEGQSHWVASNNSDNSSGFTGMPAGSLHNGALSDTGTDGYWWSTAPGDFFYLTNSMSELRHKSSAALHEGLSIRCVKD